MNAPTDFSAAQLAAARATAWHQDEKALLTIEGARNWVDHFGLVLFAPMASKLGAPAGSFIEATLGAANEAPTLAESATARALAARLIAEGSVLPLNLLGGPGDLPDFLASAKVFSYVFTMRGDKTWKQAPSTSGSVKVTPLALSVWEALSKKGAMTAAELADELGREVTESAILRALSELWQNLRIIPQLQLDENQPTLWELTSKRFAKAVKAGMNAGLPSAMSALLSLYLSQAVSATEEEVAGFLSPLTARSRVREVVHALVAGRQLAETVVDGKTFLHIPGTLPEFPEIAVPEPVEGAEPAAEDEGRIKSFTSTRKPRVDFKGKPAFGEKPRRSFGDKPSFGAGPKKTYKEKNAEERVRRPFQRKSEGDAPSFTKPWDEEKRARPAAEQGSDAAPSLRKPYAKKSFGDKPSFGARKPFGAKPAFGAKKSFGDRPARPYTPRNTEGGEGFAPRERKPYGDKSFGDRPARPYARRESSGEGFAPRERKPYGDKTSFGGPRKSFGDKPSFGGPRKSFGDKPSFGAKKAFGDRPARPYTPRNTEGGEGFAPRERKPYTPRPEGAGDRPPRGANPRTYNRKPEGSAGFERKPFRPREDGDAPRPRKSFGDKPSFGAKPSFSAKKSFGDKPSFGAKKPFGSKPSFGAKKPFGSKPSFGAKKPFGAKPGGFKKRNTDGAPKRRTEE